MLMLPFATTSIYFVEQIRKNAAELGASLRMNERPSLSIKIKFEMFIDVDFPFYFSHSLHWFYCLSACAYARLSIRGCTACFRWFFVVVVNAHCQRHLNLQTLMNSAKWNQITTITIHGNNEVEINNKNQSIHLTWLIRFCFEKPP